MSKGHDAVEQQLIQAAGSGDLEQMKALLATSIDVNALDSNGDTALGDAAYYGRVQAVELLLEHGAIVDRRFRNGWTALMQASSKGHTAIAEVLLGRGADVNAKNEIGVTPLFCASGNGHLGAVTVLLAAGADVNATDNTNRTALMAASVEGYTEIVNALLAHGADSSIRGSGFTEIGMTALQWAADEETRKALRGEPETRPDLPLRKGSRPVGTERKPKLSTMLVAACRRPKIILLISLAIGLFSFNQIRALQSATSRGVHLTTNDLFTSAIGTFFQLVMVVGIWLFIELIWGMVANIGESCTKLVGGLIFGRKSDSSLTIATGRTRSRPAYENRSLMERHPRPVAGRSEPPMSPGQRQLTQVRTIAARTYRYPAAFGVAIRQEGYTCVEQTPWGSLVFERDDCRVTISATTTGIHNLVFYSTRDGQKHELVVEGVLK